MYSWLTLAKILRIANEKYIIDTVSCGLRSCRHQFSCVPYVAISCEVWPIHTVQFSNHAQYIEEWKGKIFPGSDIDNLIDALSNLNVLNTCDSVLTGYLGSQ